MTHCLDTPQGKWSRLKIWITQRFLHVHLVKASRWHHRLPPDCLRYRLGVVKCFDATWRHVTHSITFTLWSDLHVGVSAFLRNMSFHSIPPFFFPSPVCMHTSANLPESPAATTDGEDRTYPARASSNFASTLNSIWARVAAAWLGWQPDPPPYLRLSHHNTSSTAQHASSLWQI